MLRRTLALSLLAVMPAPFTGEVCHGPRPDYRDDPRLTRLTAFFQDLRCPASALAEDFLWAADLHGLDWRLLPSIAVIETGGGKTARGHNWFGWQSGKKAFRSAREAIHWVAARLASSPLYRGRHPHSLLRVYNPAPGYRDRVVSLMRRLDPSSVPPP